MYKQHALPGSLPQYANVQSTTAGGGGGVAAGGGGGGGGGGGELLGQYVPTATENP